MSFKRARAEPEAANFAWLAADRAVRMVSGFVLGVWLARYLGPQKFGSLGYAMAVIALLGPLAELGFENVARREFIRSPEHAAITSGTVLAFRAVGGLLAIACALLFGWLFTDSALDRNLVWILSLGLLQPGLMIADSWLKARLDARSAVIPQWLAVGFGLLLQLCGIAWGAPVEYFAAVTVLEGLLVAGLVWRAANVAGLRFGRRNRDLGRQLLRECWPLAMSSAAILIYMRIDLVMLRKMVGEAEAGTYLAATRLSELAYFLPMILASTLQPSLVRAHAQAQGDYPTRLQTYFDASACLAYAFTVVIAICAEVAVRLIYGSGFIEAAPILRVHCWATVFVFLGVARNQHLINEGKTRFALFGTAFGAVLNVGLNLVLIPRWGGVGAAVATVLSYAASAWASSFALADLRWIGWQQTLALLAPPRYAWRLVRSRSMKAESR